MSGAHGGADRLAVIRVLDAALADADGVEEGAQVILDALEVSGYRVVRAGMVPHVDELAHVQQVMRDAAEVLNRGTADYGAENAAKSVGFLRELAAVVLGLDLDDVDEPDGTS